MCSGWGSSLWILKYISISPKIRIQTNPLSKLTLVPPTSVVCCHQDQTSWKSSLCHCFHILSTLTFLSLCHLCLHPALHWWHSKPPNREIQSHSLIFIHPNLCSICHRWLVFSWFTKDVIILVVFDFSCCLLPPLSPFSCPLNLWGSLLCVLALPFLWLCSFSSCHLFSVPTSLKPSLHPRPRHFYPNTWWVAMPKECMLTQNPFLRSTYICTENVMHASIVLASGILEWVSEQGSCPPGAFILER